MTVSKGRSAFKKEGVSRKLKVFRKSTRKIKINSVDEVQYAL
jgi:hypothetical protein